MATCGPASATTPSVSIIIGVYNDWKPLDRCLRSLTEQRFPPSFEVIVVDDGSEEPAPQSIRDWADHKHLTLIHQSHAGVSTARNRGLEISKGSIVLFIDADTKLQPDCLGALVAAVTRSPGHGCFQLRLVGDCSGLVGRAEHLRLTTVQEHMLQPNGSIRYLNTAGFAILRNRINPGASLFDPVALRGEDTLLLVRLMQRGELPLFVDTAIVQHAVPLSLLQYLRKSIRSAYQEAGTYRIIATMGVKIRVTNRERFGMLGKMWKISQQAEIGRTAWFVLVVRQALPRFVSLFYRRSPSTKLV